MAKTVKPSLDEQRAAFQQLRAHGLSDEQITQVAKLSPARLTALADGKARASSASELALVTRGPHFVMRVVEQQAALTFLFAHKLIRSDLAFALGVTIETLKFWDGGRAKVLRLASPDERALLLKFTQRARGLVATNPQLDLSSDDKALAKIFRDRLRPRANHRAGVRSEGRKQDLVAAMSAASLWPPATRARTLKRLLKDSNLTRAQLMRRLQLSRNLFFSLLNSSSDALMESDVIARVQELQAQVAAGNGPNNLSARFVAAMTALLGENIVTNGFERRDKALPSVYPELARVMKWSERTVRRHLPPYSAKWLEEKRIPEETVERLEKAASNLGCITSQAHTPPPSQGLAASSSPSL